MNKELSDLFVDEKRNLNKIMINVESKQVIPYKKFRTPGPKKPYDDSKDHLFYIIGGERVPAWKVEANPHMYYRGK
mgnify:CR=1 FL=1